MIWPLGCMGGIHVTYTKLVWLMLSKRHTKLTLSGAIDSATKERHILFKRNTTNNIPTLPTKNVGTEYKRIKQIKNQKNSQPTNLRMIYHKRN
jgi:hypothetical protein